MPHLSCMPKFDTWRELSNNLPQPGAADMTARRQKVKHEIVNFVCTLYYSLKRDLYNSSNYCLMIMCMA